MARQGLFGAMVAVTANRQGMERSGKARYGKARQGFSISKRITNDSIRHTED
jgi:hypothetical protein